MDLRRHGLPACRSMQAKFESKGAMRMAKKWRKPHPAIPHYGWNDFDGCWFCKTPNGCSNCKHLKKYIHYEDATGDITQSKRANKKECEK